MITVRFIGKKWREKFSAKILKWAKLKGKKCRRRRCHVQSATALK
jgi:hypothetical protein